MKFVVISRAELERAVQQFCDQKFIGKMRVKVVTIFDANVPWNATQRLPESFAVILEEEAT